ncbi:hypothetical protein VTJ49DRAFT_2376 [Mycothermus thermophilus]|uniref:V-SNARE coiled-coil homology domain-containing protein n=1 Tax=Humicola insolens TaxID=85995 RepID=A0ABR3VN05_HUMIN
MASEPYDPYVPSSKNSPYASNDTPYVGGSSSAQGTPRPGAQGSATEAIQENLNKAFEAMEDNVRMVQQRGVRLEDLQNKTDDLATSAQGFRRGANQVRKKMWWKDMKMKIWIAIGIIVLLCIIIIPPVVTSQK